MLIGDNQQQQVQLAKAEGALQRLLELRLQKDDEDCKQIADGVVAAMVSYAFFSGSVDTVCGRHVADPVNRTFVYDQACLQVRCWQLICHKKLYVNLSKLEAGLHYAVEEPRMQAAFDQCLEIKVTAIHSEQN